MYYIWKFQINDLLIQFWWLFLTLLSRNFTSSLFQTNIEQSYYHFKRHMEATIISGTCKCTAITQQKGIGAKQNSIEMYPLQCSLRY